MSAVTDFIAQLKGARVSPNIEPMRGDVDNFVLALQELSAPVENNQVANTFYAGPINNPAAPPSFRLLSVNDPIGWGFTTGSIPFMTATGIAQNNSGLFWDSVNNRLGIGTTGPGARLDVTKSVVGGNTGLLYITNSSNSGQVGNGTSIEFRTGTAPSGATPVDAKIATLQQNNNDASFGSDLAFYTSLAGTLSEQMRILRTGNVGIGTTSPSILLDVAGPIGAKVYTVATLPSAVAKPGQFAFVSDATLTTITGLGLVPTGGGTNFVPVYSDGTNWRII